MDIISEAKTLQPKLVEYRRTLHACAEIGFELPKTTAFVLSTLEKLGCKAERYEKNGVIATMGRGKRSVLLRADMDGLPIKERTGLPFACKNGNMHACGHDIHTAMLLGAVQLLKAHEKELKGRVYFLFQPAEERLLGAKEAIDLGIIKQTGASSALMIHVLTNTPLPTGTLVVSSKGVSAPSADFFTIRFKGKSCHGSAPWQGIDVLPASSVALLSLQGLIAREVSFNAPAVLTIGQMQGGVEGNVIADEVTLKGTLRAYEEATRVRVKRRLEEIIKGVSKAFRVKSKVTYDGGCPSLLNDERVSALAYKVLKEMRKGKVYTSAELSADTKKGEGGSEDFAYISREIPSVMVALACGNKKDGYTYPLHHPKTSFDESAFYVGTATYAQFAFKGLQE